MALLLRASRLNTVSILLSQDLIANRQFATALRLNPAFSFRMSGNRGKNGSTNVREWNADKKTRLRGHPSDQEEVRLSKTLSWVLRHGAKTEGLYMRKDCYVRVNELVRTSFDAEEHCSQ